MASSAPSPRPTLAPLLARALALLGCIGVAKAALLLAGAEDYYQAHWRTAQEPSPIAFHLWLPALAVLIALVSARVSLTLTGQKPIRIRTTALFATGILGVTWFLSLSKVDRNYLYPLVKGILKPTALLDYLAVDLFFNPPYAILYVLILVGSWVALTKRNREHWIFAVLGTLAAVYILLNRAHFAETAIFAWLPVAAGAAGLLAFNRAERPQGLWFYGCATGALVLLFHTLGRADPDLAALEPVHFLLLSLALGLFVPAHIALRRYPGLDRVTHLLPAAFVTFLFVADSHYPNSINYRNVLALALTSPVNLLSETVFITLLAAALFPVVRRHPKTGLLAFDAAATGIILLCVADAVVFRRMGTRIDWHVLTMSDDPVFLWRTVRHFIPQLIGLVLAAAAGYTLCTRFLRARLSPALASAPSRNGSLLFGLGATALLVFGSVLSSSQPDRVRPSVFGNVLGTSPLVQSWKVRRLDPETFAAQWTALDLPDPTLAPPGQPARQRPLNVVLVLLESVYNPYLSLFGGPDETQPLLRGYLNRMELFPNFRSSFANSMHARFATFNGIVPPNPYISYLAPHVPAPSLFEILKAHDYHVSLYYSSSRRYTRLGDYLSGRGIDVLHDWETMPGATPEDRVSWGVEESATLAAMQRQLDAYADSGQRFFLTYIPAAPHMPYDVKTGRFEQFEEGIPSLTGDYSGAYKNSLLYMDWVLAGLVEHLQKTSLLERTLVVITSDHGEMLGDRNQRLGHGWNLEPWLTGVPLILLDPDRPGPRTNYVRGSQVDLLPTVLDRLGLPIPEHQFYQGTSLDRLRPENPRTILLSSHQQRAIIHGNRYYLFDPAMSRPENPDPQVRVFELSNEGSREIAHETNAPPAFAKELRSFDAFQESLVVHYARYREWLTSSNPRFRAALPRKQASNTSF